MTFCCKPSVATRVVPSLQVSRACTSSSSSPSHVYLQYKVGVSCSSPTRYFSVSASIIGPPAHLVVLHRPRPTPLIVRCLNLTTIAPVRSAIHPQSPEIASARIFWPEWPSCLETQPRVAGIGLQEQLASLGTRVRYAVCLKGNTVRPDMKDVCPLLQS